MFRFIWRLIKRTVALCIILILLAVAGLAYAQFIEPNRLNIKEISDISYSIHEPIIIAIFADTHFGFDYTTEDFQKAIDAINSKAPDYILFAGDLIDYLDQYEGDTSEISKKLSELTAAEGKYAVFGNHDYGGGAENAYESIMNKGGFTVLKNEIITFDDNNFRIIGIDDVLIGYGDPSIADSAAPDMYNLVLCHEPDVIDEVYNSNSDFFVSGHTHGGQIRIPHYTQMFLPAYGRTYVKGEYHLDNPCNTVVYVNPGLGTTKIPARFGSVPEVTILTINPAS